MSELNLNSILGTKLKFDFRNHLKLFYDYTESPNKHGIVRDEIELFYTYGRYG